jgi:hypothetical protein
MLTWSLDQPPQARPIPRALSDEQLTELVISEVSKAGGGVEVTAKRKWSKVARSVSELV